MPHCHESRVRHTFISGYPSTRYYPPHTQNQPHQSPALTSKRKSIINKRLESHTLNTDDPWTLKTQKSHVSCTTSSPANTVSCVGISCIRRLPLRSWDEYQPFKCHNCHWHTRELSWQTLVASVALESFQKAATGNRKGTEDQSQREKMTKAYRVLLG